MTEGEKRKLDLLRLRFIEWLGACNYAVRSREEYDRSMKAFINWLSDNTDVTGINEILPLHINQYQLSLCGILNGEGEKTLAISTQSKLLTVVRTWFDWLVSEQQLLLNPASSLQMPRLPQRLPRNILTQGEARLLLESTPIEKPQDIRDRAILEILYGSAIRRGELLSLTIYDVDIETKVLRIEQGKGGASRLVPLTETSINALKLYLDEIRIKWVSNISGAILFLSSRSGGALSTKDVGRIVENGRERAGITKSISPHTLRHSCATHLLQEDADIRQIQKLLGHRKLSTTEIYTHVEIGDLQKVIERCHPREKVMRDPDEQDDTKIS